MTPRAVAGTLLAAVVIYAIVVLLFTVDEPIDVSAAERHFQALERMRGER